jgi:hypothetical protein
MLRSYDRDFAEWAVRNAELLHSGRVAEADPAYVGEEIADMGIHERPAVQSRLARLGSHFYARWVGTARWLKHLLDLNLRAMP